MRGCEPLLVETEIGTRCPPAVGRRLPSCVMPCRKENHTACVEASRDSKADSKRDSRCRCGPRQDRGHRRPRRWSFGNANQNATGEGHPRHRSQADLRLLTGRATNARCSGIRPVATRKRREASVRVRSVMRSMPVCRRRVRVAVSGNPTEGVATSRRGSRSRRRESLSSCRCSWHMARFISDFEGGLGSGRCRLHRTIRNKQLTCATGSSRT